MIILLKYVDLLREEVILPVLDPHTQLSICVRFIFPRYE